MPSAWRIVKQKHAAAAFDGEGARAHGGRWNSPGRPVIYTADSPSLAALEILVGLNESALLASFVLIPVEIPDALVREVETKRFPKLWRAYPAPPELQLAGDRWLESKASAVLRVPSAVIEEQSNYLLDPLHDDFPKIRIGKPRPFAFDPRLLRR